MQAFYLARQPIYDNRLEVAGYELLFRGGLATTANVADGDQATSEVLTSSVVDIGLDNLVGPHPAFINATRTFLDGQLLLPELKSRVVLEVLEDIEIDEGLVGRLTDLSRQGYRLALDDFVYRPECEPLLRLADYVKLDVQALDADELAEHVERVRRHGARLLAEKVEDHAMLATCRKLGFDLYQGFFFCRPNLISGARPEASRAAVVNLISRLQDPDTGLAELEHLVSCDAALAYRLLKYINSAYCGMRTKVASIRQALLMVGTNLVRSWATLLLLSRLGDGKPSELVNTALLRARMCELAGAGDLRHHDGEYFTVGMLSVLDALMDMPMEQVVETLPFDTELCDALTERKGDLGTALERVLDYERGAPAGQEVSAGLYLQALMWATETRQAIGL